MGTEQTRRIEPHGVTNAKGGRLKQERAVQTRQDILQAAGEAFAAKGFANVTILDVAELAGLTKGAVYFHFANKETLAQAVAAEFYRRLPLLVTPLLDTELPALRKISAVLHRTALAFRDDRLIQAGARLQIEQASIQAPLPTPYSDFEEMLVALLAEAQRAEELRPGLQPESIARVLVSAFFGAQHISWVRCNRQDIEERVQEIIEAVVPSLGVAA